LPDLLVDCSRSQSLSGISVAQPPELSSPSRCWGPFFRLRESYLLSNGLPNKPASITHENPILPAPTTLPNPLHTVGIKSPVMTDQVQILHGRLGNEQAIKRIPVVPGQVQDMRDMTVFNWQNRNTSQRYLKFPSSRFGGSWHERVFGAESAAGKFQISCS
jgi:hypothetical protein